MAQDLALVVDDTGFYDIGIDGNDFASTDGFRTALEVSILTDARAGASEVPNAFLRRGYVGDILTSNIGRSLGSTLWLYSQSRLTTEIINKIRADARNSLLWLTEDRIARSVTVTAKKTGIRVVEVTIDIVTNEGAQQRYTVLWRLTIGS